VASRKTVSDRGIDTDLLPLVPVGKENAVSARQIWEIKKLWSAATFKTKLNDLANSRRWHGGQNWKVLYFRKNH
jgi:hypothetical protein